MSSGLLERNAGEVETAGAGGTAAAARTRTAGWLLVQVEADRRESVAQAVAGLPDVQAWQRTSGAYDLVVQLLPRAAASACIARLRALAGVQHVVCCRPGPGRDVVELP